MKSTFPVIYAALAMWGAATFAVQAQQPSYPVYQVTNAPTPVPAATPAPPPSSPAKFSAADLEKLAMPMALYPDPLISIMLPAAAYPTEIVQAARFVRDTNNVPKLDAQPWDENVTSVARIPDLIAMMDKDLDWTIRLGQAFIEQPKELMDTIQALRAKAQKAGTLQTTPQQIVTVTNQIIERVVEQQTVVVTNTVVQIQPANPQVVYVPTYPPTVYYPPPGYVYDPYAPLVTFGVGLAVGAIIANNCDWHGGGIWVGGGGMVMWGGGGDVDIDINNNVNIDRGARPTPQSGRPTSGTTQQKWQPDQNRLRASGAPSTAQSMEARGWGGDASSRPTPSTGAVGAGARPSTGAVSPGARPTTTPAARPSTPSAARPSTQPAARPSTQPAARPSPQPAARPSPSPSVNRAPAGGGSAFSGVSQGAASRDFSSRGAASRGGGGFSGGGGRGGGRR